MLAKEDVTLPGNEWYWLDDWDIDLSSVRHVHSRTLLRVGEESHAPSLVRCFWRRAAQWMVTVGRTLTSSLLSRTVLVQGMCVSSERRGSPRWYTVSSR